MRTLMLTIAAVIGLSGAVSAQNKLMLEVSGLSPKRGELYIAVFDSQDNFMKKMATGVIIEVKGTTAIAEFDLAAGNYAITMFQDENLNGELDLGQYGIPQEKYGFSNNAKPIMGPPSFETCSFEVKGGTVQKIQMQ